jgi:TonB family protein
MRGKLLITILLLLAGGIAALRAQDIGPPNRVGGEVSRPEKISGPPPVYTEMARKARVTGVVIVEAVIDEQGNVTDAHVLKGLPMGLDQSALEAVMEWKFEPAQRYGQSVPVYYTLTINYTMQDTYLGPTFARFLENNPEFAAHLRGKNFEEAGELLDRWEVERPDDSTVVLARVYLLVEQERLEEAWQLAQSLRDSIEESGHAEELQGLAVEAQSLQALVKRLEANRPAAETKPGPTRSEG